MRVEWIVCNGLSEGVVTTFPALKG